MCRCSTTKAMDDCSHETIGKPTASNPLNSAFPRHHPNFPFGEDNNITIQEDETCFLLSIEMPNVHKDDMQVSLRKNILTLSGYRRSRMYSNPESCGDENDGRMTLMDRSSTKRQRLSRHLEIDSDAIDITRAMASIWNGCYTLYAPKRRPNLNKGITI